MLCLAHQQYRYPVEALILLVEALILLVETLILLVETLYLFVETLYLFVETLYLFVETLYAITRFIKIQQSSEWLMFFLVKSEKQMNFLGEYPS
ncbi:MAG: hypothetical protein ACI8VC_000889 [Candidatus Endobugula sp.]|jgi:hypothetical protein